MCGIAGIISTGEYVSKELVTVSSACLRHRGPQGDGVWMNEEHSVALAHSRLAVIDTSEAAAQPMTYAGRFHIVHNGELYNYIEIKAQLEQKGYRFTSHSDTEVILAAYDAWGKECLQRFDGMFAFAIWDEKKQQLFAARDRLGEKPFFFFYDEKQLLFASEMKWLWRMGAEKKVNHALLYNFLTIGYTSNPADPQETFYNNIFKLPAASYLMYSKPANELKIENYWQVFTESREISEDEAIEQFRHLFSESIRKRLRSDVAIGTSLSGGLDSSAVVAFCQRQPSEHYTHKCFTAAFEGFEKNELHYGQQVAKRFGLEQHIINIGENELPALMTKVMQHQEEPVGSASALAQFRVFETVQASGVTVLLDGQGADELLAGYHKYYKWYWRELYQNKSLGKSKELECARQLGITDPFGLANKIAAAFPEFTSGILQTRRSKKAYRHPDLDRDFAFENKYNSYYSTPTVFTLNGALYFNTFVNGLEELLRYADRNSMAHAVEVRLPFLDHHLVEFMFSLPPQFKIHSGWTKWLLRKATENMLPQNIAWRKDKVGFEPPQKTWMENKNVQEAISSAKQKLAKAHVLTAAAAAKKIKPHNAYAAQNFDWKYWSASFLFD